MVVRNIFICLAFLYVLTCPAKADTWTDPTMAEMIEESDLIGVFRVVVGGVFKASVKPVKLYKGNAGGNIWLTGFSNTYGPFNVLRPGELYFLFITRYKTTKGRFHSSSHNGRRIVMRGLYNAHTFVSENSSDFEDSFESADDKFLEW